MNLEKLFETISPVKLDTWLRNLHIDEEEAKSHGWRHYLKKDELIISYIVLLTKLNESFNLELDEDALKASVGNRKMVAEHYGFDEVEDLVYDNPQSNKLRKFLSKFPDLDIFQEWLSFNHSILTRLEIPPEKTRMAISDGRLRVMIGKRVVSSLSWKNDRYEVGLVIQEESLNDAWEVQDTYQYKGKDKLICPSFFVQSWAEIPDEALVASARAFELQYESVKNQSRVSFLNTGAKTTNGALQYVIFNSSDIKEWIKSEETNTKSNSYLEKESTVNKEVILKHSLNQILFGPPGTGKTYNTIDISLQAVDPAEYERRKAERSSLQSRFKELMIDDWDAGDGRICFTTFHQSFVYEDFIEGIKPVEPHEDDEFLQYSIEDGVFKRLCNLAAYEFIKDSSRAKNTDSFDNRFDAFLENVEENLAQGGEFKIYTKSGQEVFISAITSQNNFRLHHLGSEKEYTVSRSRLEKLYLSIDDFDALPNIYQVFRDIIGGSNATLYWAILNQIKLLDDDQFSNDSISPAEKPIETKKTYDQKKKLVENADWTEIDFSKKSVPNYILVIDEINRGNVSQIFGELITLIEADKRIGCDEMLSTTLPYSKMKFAVPPNLYILGTMNTADRSVEALDTALRRRFSFIEMPPKDDFPSFEETVHGYKLKDILNTINGRIEKLLNKDHLIGHAYFLKINHKVHSEREIQLKQVLQNKILPLLQEYFFGDFGKIGLVMGSGFVQSDKEKSSAVMFADFDHNSKDQFEGREVYRISDVLHVDFNLEEALQKLMTKG